MKPQGNPNKEEKEYMWLGYGNYGGQPAPQVGGGLVRDPNILKKLLQLIGFNKKPSSEKKD